MDENLSNKHFESRDIDRLLHIDRNKLFYWIKTHRLLSPDIEEGKGTGSRSKFSFNNLLELTFIKSLVEFGIDLNAVSEIKTELDSYKSELIRSYKNLKSVDFKDEICLIKILRKEKGYEIIFSDAIEDKYASSPKQFINNYVCPQNTNACLILNIKNMIADLINEIGNT